jgi:hypothetical protein
MDAHPRARMALIAFIVIMAAVLTFLLLNLAPLVAGGEPAQPQLRRVRSSVTSSVSLEDAGKRAATRVRSWAPDAVLVRVEGAWYVTPGWEQVTVPPVAWSFYYYSPAERSLAAAVIDDDLLLWVPPFVIPSAPRPLTGYPPAYGAEGAWLTFRAAGADLFLRQHPEAQVHFRLQGGPEAAAWSVSAFDTGEYFRVVIDSGSGQVLTPEE